VGKDFYQVTTPPTDDKVPVTLKEAKNFLRVETNADDLLITALLGSAVAELEKHTNRLFITRTILGKFETQAVCTSKLEQFPFIEVYPFKFNQVGGRSITPAARDR